jgi:serine/threonine protein kinase
MSLPDAGVRVIGRYALHDEIAAGGMATVHVGRLLGPAGFSRTVAIKRLHAQFAKDPDFVSMFLDEARLAARVRHPNVIGTLDIVALSGELFLVMEYVAGESLARLWRAMREAGKTIPVPIAIAIFVGVLDGLHAAHEATNDRGEPMGIVHRDVSPHNVLVGTDGVARVLDFGVAKAFGRLQTTREGQLKGKISYMAPEQVQGIVDRTTDIYAASVALWEALTGRRLFFAENEARTLANVLYPKVEAPGRSAADIPPALDEVILRGLNPEPSARYPTAREMARALQLAVPPAPAFTVGDWVEATSGKALAARALRVASIERILLPDSGAYLPMSSSSIPPPISSVGLRALPPTTPELISSGPDSSPQVGGEVAGEEAAGDDAPVAVGRPRRSVASVIAATGLLMAVGALVTVSVARVASRPHRVPLNAAVNAASAHDAQSARDRVVPQGDMAMAPSPASSRSGSASPLSPSTGGAPAAGVGALPGAGASPSHGPSLPASGPAKVSAGGAVVPSPYATPEAAPARPWHAGPGAAAATTVATPTPAASAAPKPEGEFDHVIDSRQ